MDLISNRLRYLEMKLVQTFTHGCLVYDVVRIETTGN